MSAVAQNLIEKSGSWYSFRGERIGQGRENARAYLVENPAVMEQIDAELRRALGLTPGKPAAAEQEQPAARAKTA